MFTYTRRNQLETYVLPDAGEGTATEVRTYDESKRLKEVQRPDGKLITFAFKSASDRLESITSPRGVTSFSYHPINGMISEIEEPDGQKLSFEYEGTLPTRTTWTGEVSSSVGRGYDENFRVASLDVNGEDPVFYTYDDDNLLTSAGELIITRDPDSGREVETQLGNVKTERTYTSFGEPETYTAKFNETELYYEHYTYNKLGWITDLERRQKGLNELLHYEYDERGRLEEVWKGGALESSYTYDDNSNRLSYTGPLGNATGTYDTRDRMLTYGGASYTWTEAGELLTKTEGSETTTYDYDVFGNLRKVMMPNGIEIEYLTDGTQRRIGKKINGVLVQQWLYQNQLEPVAELDGDGNLVARFVYGTRGHVPDYLVKNGNIYRYVNDQLGSPRLLVDSVTGVIAQELRYDEFGRILLDTSSGFQTFGFSGGFAAPEMESTRLGIRDYSSQLGRWASTDPLRFASKSANMYVYSRSSPISFIDPAGLLSAFAGAGANVTPLFGWEGSAGFFGSGPDMNFGLFGAVGTTGGVQAGGDLFVGFAVGDSCDLAGRSKNYNLGIGPASFTLLINPKDKSFLGLSVGVGPSFPLINFSNATDETRILSLRELLDSVLSWEW